MSRLSMLDSFSPRRSRTQRRDRCQSDRNRRLFLENLEARQMLAADVAISKVDSIDPVPVGNSFTYTITVVNNGPDAAADVQFFDTTPANTTKLSFSQTSGPAFTLGGNASSSTGSIASLASGATATFELLVRVNPGVANNTTITNNVAVATGTEDSDPNNNIDSESTTAQNTSLPNLQVTKTDSPTTVTAGSNLTYTIVVSNIGAAEAQNIDLTDVLPVGTTFVSFTAPAGWTATTPAVGGTGTVSASADGLAAGTDATFTLVANVNANVADASSISNTAEVVTTSVDTDTGNNADTEATTVSTSADLSVTKSDSPDPVAVDGEITYTVTVTNNGPSDAQSVSLSDVIPTGTTFVELIQNSGPAFTLSTPAVGGTGTATATLATLASGASATFTFTVDVDASVASGATITNTAVVASTTADANLDNNTDVETTIVTDAVEADLQVTKTDSPDAVTAGTNLTYTITVSNVGGADALNVDLTDAVPAGTTFVSLSAPAGWTTTTPAVGGTGDLTASLATLAAGADATFTLVVNVNASTLDGTSLSNTAIVATTSAEASTANNSDTEATAVVASADLSVTKTDSPDPVAAGGSLSYTITVTNAGPSDAQSVTLSDVIPTNTTFASLLQGSGPAFALTTPAVGGTGTATGTVATLAAGASATFTFVVTVDAGVSGGTTISNTAAVASVTADADAANNSDTETTTVTADAQADLQVTKTDSPATVVAGENLTYSITVANIGTEAAQNVQLSDVVPTGTTFVSLSAPAGWTSTTPAVGGTGTINSSIASLAAGASATFTVVVRVNANVLAGTQISNTATATTASADANAVNNTDIEVSDVTAEADVSVTKTDTPNPVVPGGNITYTITVSNTGSSDAQAVLLSDLVPTDTTFVSLAQNSGAAFTLSSPAVGGTGTASASIATLAAGASATFTLVVAVDAGVLDGTTISNTATVATTTADVNAANNTDTETTIVQEEVVIDCPEDSAQLIDDPNLPGRKILLICGTSDHDHILIEPRPSNKLQIRVKNTGRLLGIFPAGPISRIVALGHEGNDVIFVNSRIGKNVELHGNEGHDKLVGAKGHDDLFGGEGNDTLLGGNGHDRLFGGSGDDHMKGGSGRDTLFGEAGNDFLFGDSGNDILLGDEGDDHLFGGTGRDLMIGGEGRDRVLGQTDDDILIGGTTDFDFDEAALLDILIQWSTRASFNSRIADLEATLNESTVFDDGEQDELNGAAGRDWFLDFALEDRLVGFSGNKRTGDRRN